MKQSITIHEVEIENPKEYQKNSTKREAVFQADDPEQIKFAARVTPY